MALIETSSLAALELKEGKSHLRLRRDLTRDEGFCKGGVNIHYLEYKLAGEKR